MRNVKSSRILQAKTSDSDAQSALSSIAQELDAKNASLSILFLSNTYNLSLAANAIQTHFGPHVIACTTAGEINGQGYENDSISGISFPDSDVTATTIELQNLEQVMPSKSLELKLKIDDIQMEHEKRVPGGKSFAVLLIDGLSVREESVTEVLAAILGDTPIVGGSAGDGLNFGKTYVYSQGLFKSGMATLTIVTTLRSFEVFKTQHFEETSNKFTITDSDPKRRVVRAINGEPAVDFYAKMLGITPDQFTPTVFSKNPLILKIGGEYYVRSIQKANPDKSLTFYCAIENGLVLILGNRKDIVENAKSTFQNLEKKIGPIESSLLFECILRRLEVLDLPTEERKKFMALYEQYKTTGFHTYGEQYSGIHINQTLTGVAFGKKRSA